MDAIGGVAHPSEVQGEEQRNAKERDIREK
jgi:hypothetical protein